MKKCLFLMTLLLLTGCFSGEVVKCNIKGKDAEFTLKNGIISNYKLDGKRISNREIDEINGLNFTSSKNNEDGKKILEKYINSLGGYCEK